MTPMLVPSYPWGQGSPQRMKAPEIKRGAYEKPDEIGSSGGFGGVAIVVAGFVVLGLLLDRKRRKGFWRKRK